MSYQFENITVLIVEDNQPMLDLAKSLMSAFGVKNVLGAKDGEEGFKRFCEYNPDIVLSDWMMKPMDGISLARRIRNDFLSPNKFVPFILMTGFSEKRRVMPFTARDLYKRLYQVIERPRQFVRSDDFFGPDRRRKSPVNYDGPLRRENDIKDGDYYSVFDKDDKTP